MWIWIPTSENASFNCWESGLNPTLALHGNREWSVSAPPFFFFMNGEGIFL